MVKIEPGKCDICGEFKQRTAKEHEEVFRACSDCANLNSIMKPDNRRIRSSKEHREERERRVSDNSWIHAAG